MTKSFDTIPPIQEASLVELLRHGMADPPLPRIISSPGVTDQIRLTPVLGPTQLMEIIGNVMLILAEDEEGDDMQDHEGKNDSRSPHDQSPLQ